MWYDVISHGGCQVMVKAESREKTLVLINSYESYFDYNLILGQDSSDKPNLYGIDYSGTKQQILDREYEKVSFVYNNWDIILIDEYGITIIKFDENDYQYMLDKKKKTMISRWVWFYDGAISDIHPVYGHTVGNEVTYAGLKYLFNTKDVVFTCEYGVGYLCDTKQEAEKTRKHFIEMIESIAEELMEFFLNDIQPFYLRNSTFPSKFIEAYKKRVFEILHMTRNSY